MAVGARGKCCKNVSVAAVTQAETHRERERERERVRFRAREKAMNTKSDMNDTNELLRWVGFTSL